MQANLGFIILLRSERGEWRDSGEGPFDSMASAQTFADAECGVSYKIVDVRHELQQLWALCSRTATMLEEESPGLAECGYWSRDEKDVFEIGKVIAEKEKSCQK